MTTSIIRRPCIAAGPPSGTHTVSAPSAAGRAARDAPTDPQRTECDQEQAAAASPYVHVFEAYAASEYAGLGHLFIG